MTNTGHGANSFLGFAAQTAWNTDSGGTYTYLPCRPGGLKKTQEPVFSTQSRGFTKRYGRNANQQVEGQVPMDFYFEGLETLMNDTFSRTSTEVASWIVSAASSNNTIQFQEDGGSTLTATVADGSYTSATLPAALKTAMEAAGSGTYSASYSTSTKKWTITVSGAVSAVQLLGTGNFEDDLGFTSASSSASSVTSDTAVGAVYDHVYTFDDTGALPNASGLTLYDHKDLKTWKVRSAFITALQIGFQDNAHFVDFIPTFLAASRSKASAVTPTFGTGVPANPADNLTLTVVTATGSRSMETTAFNVHLTIPTALKHSVTSRTAKKANRSDRVTIEGSATWDWTNDNLATEWLDDWDNDAPVDITAALTGNTIRSSVTQKVTIELPRCHVKGDDPVHGGAGAMEQAFNWESAYDHTDSEDAFKVTLRNQTYIA